MLRQGLVQEVRGPAVQVKVDRCDDLSACGGHGCFVCRGNEERRKILVWFETSERLEPGDEVEVDVLMPGFMLSLLVTFGLPLACAVTGGLVGYNLHLTRDELGAVLGGGVGLGVGFMLMLTLSRIMPSLQPRTRLLRVLSRGNAQGSDERMPPP